MEDEPGITALARPSASTTAGTPNKTHHGTPLTTWLSITLAQATVSPRVCIALRDWHRDPTNLGQALRALLDPGGHHRDSDCPLSAEHLRHAASAATQQRVDEALEWQARSAQHHLVGLDHPAYPTLLRQIPDAPLLLYAIGNLAALDGPCLGMVGSRKASHHGLNTAALFAEQLAAAGIAICSGLAIGIDGAAHRGALAAKGLTIAVAATDAARIYPKQHQVLNQQIIDSGGLILHEFPFGTPVRPWCFPQRNRIISGLSHGILVIESALPSGTLTTARHALEQGREVMAIPGSIHHREAKGCHALIKDGAALVETPDDVLHCLGPALRAALADRSQASLQLENTPTPSETLETSLSTAEKSVLSHMTTESVSVDILLAATGLPIAQLSATLGTMELKRLIMPVSGGRYTRLTP